MAIVRLGNQPDLTKEEAREAFARHFAGKYSIERSSAFNRDFIVKKSGWVGVGVRLKQEKNDTILIFTGIIPNTALSVIFSGIASYLILRPRWHELEGEITEFVENEPSFRRAAPVSGIEKLAA
jgi:hypothetical protein